MDTTFILQKLPDTAVILCTLLPQWSMESGIAPLVEEVYILLHRVKHPTFLILDLRQAPYDLNDIVLFANQTARGEFAFAHHSNLRGLVLVAEDPLIPLTAEGMRTATFGFAQVSAYGTLEEAYEVVQQRMNGSG